MRYLKRLVLAVASAAFFVASAMAQNAGTVTNHAFAIGKGPGTTGYTSLLCGSAQLAVGQSAADPVCRTITGDVTINASGVTAIGATKVTSAMLNADVFSTAHSWSGQQTFVAPVLGTPASATLTNATGLPISTGVSGLGTGVASALAVNVGTAGAPVVNGGALGTPSSGILTNATGLPTAGLVNNAVTNAKLATQADGTIKSNISGSTAAPSDNTITAVLDKQFGTAQGTVVYRGASAWSALAPGTAGQFLTTQGASANPNWSSGGAGTGTVTQVVCGTGLSGGTITASGTCALALNSATLQTNLSNPTGTISTTGVMMGLGSTCKLTPVYSSRVHVLFIGTVQTSLTTTFSGTTAKFGTGTAPANGAAFSGTSVGNLVLGTSATAGQALPFSAGGIVTGLTPGTAYWFDLDLQSSISTSTASYQSISCTIMEF